MKKSYLIDTSIILDDVENLFFLHQNGENAIFICDVTLSELDKKKDLSNETGFFAREFFRNLGDFASTSSFNPMENDKIHTFYFTIHHQKIPLQMIHRPNYKTKFQDYGLNDARILEIAKDYHFVLLTNDISLKVYALSLNLSSQSLLRDRIENPQAIEFLNHFQIHKSNIKENLEHNAAFAALKNWSLIEISEQDNTENSLYLTGRKHYGIKLDNSFYPLDFDARLEEDKLYINPINLEQKFLYTLLTHPKNRITICSGATGSGKTLIALQAGLHLLKKGVVNGIIYLRNTITANDKEAELGFRKGDENQKLHYFMYPLFSAINFMITKMQKESLAKRIEYRGEANSIQSQEATEYFLNKHNIEVLDIAHARGVSIAKKFVIFDEAQNASNATIKLIGTRMAEDSRIVFLGDPMQIDHPYLSKYRNGLISLLKKAKQDDFLAGIVLHQTIRSEIASWFEENF